MALTVNHQRARLCQSIPGAARAISDIVGGHVPLAVINVTPFVGYFREVIGADVQAASWFGCFVQSRTPGDIQKRLEDSIRRALLEPSVKQRPEAVHISVSTSRMEMIK